MVIKIYACIVITHEFQKIHQVIGIQLNEYVWFARWINCKDRVIG